MRRTPEVKANRTDNDKRNGSETNEGKRPTRSLTGNRGDRELWSGTRGKSFQDWNWELLPLMSWFRTKQ
eukprot:2560820-Heterocapsa_arctica.AAC.1